LADTQKAKRPRDHRGRFQFNQRRIELVFVRGVPGNARNVRAADADVGKLAIAKARQLAQALVVTLPLLDEAGECGNHGVLLSFISPAAPVVRFEGKIGICWLLKSNIVALQLGEKRIA
jgi:hypothetical protein